MDNLKEIIEAILFVSGDAVDISDLAEKLELSQEEVFSVVNQLKAEKEQNKSGIQIIFFNDKVQLSSNPKYAEKVAQVLNPIREKNLTRVVLETCSIIAYKQPITRLEIENVRGANSDYAISALLDNELIEVVGRKDVVGKPLLFGTTEKFLKKFSLQSLDELPDYDELINRISVIYQEKEGTNAMFNLEEIDEKSDENGNEIESVDEKVGTDAIDLDASIDEMSDDELLSVLRDNKVYDDYDIIGKQDLTDKLMDSDDFDYLGIAEKNE